MRNPIYFRNLPKIGIFFRSDVTFLKSPCLQGEPTIKIKLLDQRTDEVIMEEVARGNLDAMTYLFERYHKWVFNFLFQMSPNQALCEDLTQTVFYKVMRYRNSYKGGKFASWIFTIARNVYADHYRKQKSMQSEVSMDGIAEQSAEEDMSEEHQRLHFVLGRLPVEDKELVVMSRFQGMKYQQIAEIIGSNEGAVKTRVHRIIKKMRTLYFETV